MHIFVQAKFLGKYPGRISRQNFAEQIPPMHFCSGRFFIQIFSQKFQADFPLKPLDASQLFAIPDLWKTLLRVSPRKIFFWSPLPLISTPLEALHASQMFAIPNLCITYLRVSPRKFFFGAFCP